MVTATIFAGDNYIEVIEEREGNQVQRHLEDFH